MLPGWIDAAAERARAAGADIDAALVLAAEVGARLPAPGEGDTETRWRALALIAAADLTPARVLEAHSDALAILRESGELTAPVGVTWGVFAAEQPGVRLDAVERVGEWRVSGVKPWCSLARRVDRALVTAHVPGGRRLFDVDLRADGVAVADTAGWIARGLAAVPSGPVTFTDVPARPVGDIDWYLRRPGFAWGGMGVAACWAGGAEGLLPALRAHAERHADDPLALMHLGAADAAVHGARSCLADAARLVDAGAARGPAGATLALRVRAVVAQAAESTLRACFHALGPAPLAFDEQHARRVADLEIYVRQHHAERDLAALGSAALDEP